MQEILDYLQTKEDYALFAGFAAFLHTGVEPSPDIDVFFSSAAAVKASTDDFTTKGWNRIRTGYTDDYFMNTVEKNGTTFDIIYSAPAKEVLLPHKVRVRFKGTYLYTISVEALLLTKMNQLTSLERSDYKTKRDREVIHILRQKIDVQELRELLKDVKDSFWVKGHF